MALVSLVSAATQISTALTSEEEFLSLKGTYSNSGSGGSGSSSSGKSGKGTGGDGSSGARPGRQNPRIAKGSRTNTRMRAAMVWGMIMNNALDRKEEMEEIDNSYKIVANECFIHGNQTCTHCCVSDGWAFHCGAYSDCYEVGFMTTFFNYFVWVVLIGIWISLCVCPRHRKLDLNKDRY